nr:hypothetical protein [uncultured Prevotella sp.]
MDRNTVIDTLQQRGWFITTGELEARVHQAVENFMQGYGCCQSVVAAFADLYGLDETV